MAKALAARWHLYCTGLGVAVGRARTVLRGIKVEGMAGVMSLCWCHGRATRSLAPPPRRSWSWSWSSGRSHGRDRAAGLLALFGYESERKLLLAGRDAFHYFFSPSSTKRPAKQERRPKILGLAPMVGYVSQLELQRLAHEC